MIINFYKIINDSERDIFEANIKKKTLKPKTIIRRMIKYSDPSRYFDNFDEDTYIIMRFHMDKLLTKVPDDVEPTIDTFNSLWLEIRKILKQYKYSSDEIRDIYIGVHNYTFHKILPDIKIDDEPKKADRVYQGLDSLPVC